MNKYLVRIMAVLLIPCLVLEPSPAHAFANLCIHSRPLIYSDPNFQNQALSLSIENALKPYGRPTVWRLAIVAAMAAGLVSGQTPAEKAAKEVKSVESYRSEEVKSVKNIKIPDNLASELITRAHWLRLHWQAYNSQPIWDTHRMQIYRRGPPLITKQDIDRDKRHVAETMAKILEVTHDPGALHQWEADQEDLVPLPWDLVDHELRAKEHKVKKPKKGSQHKGREAGSVSLLMMALPAALLLAAPWLWAHSLSVVPYLAVLAGAGLLLMGNVSLPPEIRARLERPIDLWIFDKNGTIAWPRQRITPLMAAQFLEVVERNPQARLCVITTVGIKTLDRDITSVLPEVVQAVFYRFVHSGSLGFSPGPDATFLYSRPLSSGHNFRDALVAALQGPAGWKVVSFLFHGRIYQIMAHVQSVLTSDLTPENQAAFIKAVKRAADEAKERSPLKITFADSRALITSADKEDALVSFVQTIYRQNPKQNFKELWERTAVVGNDVKDLPMLNRAAQEGGLAIWVGGERPPDLHPDAVALPVAGVPGTAAALATHLDWRRHQSSPDSPGLANHSFAALGFMPSFATAAEHFLETIRSVFESNLAIISLFFLITGLAFWPLERERERQNRRITVNFETIFPSFLAKVAAMSGTEAGAFSLSIYDGAKVIERMDRLTAYPAMVGAVGSIMVGIGLSVLALAGLYGMLPREPQVFLSVVLLGAAAIGLAFPWMRYRVNRALDDLSQPPRIVLPAAEDQPAHQWGIPLLGKVVLLLLAAPIVLWGAQTLNILDLGAALTPTARAIHGLTTIMPKELFLWMMTAGFGLGLMASHKMRRSGRLKGDHLMRNWKRTDENNAAARQIDQELKHYQGSGHLKPLSEGAEDHSETADAEENSKLTRRRLLQIFLGGVFAVSGAKGQNIKDVRPFTEGETKEFVKKLIDATEPEAALFLEDLNGSDEPPGIIEMKRNQIAKSLVVWGLKDPDWRRRSRVRRLLVKLSALGSPYFNSVNTALGIGLKDAGPILTSSEKGSQNYEEAALIRDGAIRVMLQTNLDIANAHMGFIQPSYPPDAGDLVVRMVSYAYVLRNFQKAKPSPELEEPDSRLLAAAANSFLESHSEADILRPGPDRHFLRMTYYLALLAQNQDSRPVRGEELIRLVYQIINDVDADWVPSRSPGAQIIPPTMLRHAA